MFEAKVLADASSGIGFDVLRNQLERSCFVLLTPEISRDHPQSCLYGWLMSDYRSGLMRRRHK